ncbi:MAG: hypothetical protein RLZZ229_268 [Actinomycetota bacterium]|jgi:hexosaminidase
MLNNSLIPSPTAAVTGQGSYQLPSSGVIGYSHAPLAEIAEYLAAELAPTVIAKLDGQVSEPSNLINLELLGADAELSSLPASAGVPAGGQSQQSEAYGLEITERGIRIWALTEAGIFYGVVSLILMVQTSENGQLNCLRIVDNPRFAWRGFSFDVARTFFTVEQVKSVIDMIAKYKFNVLHMHLSDDQGWRLEIANWPKLTEIGGQGAAAGRKGGFYTAAEFADIVAHAAARHIALVPELDMPGHLTAAFISYPELANDGWQPPNAENPFSIGYLDPAKPLTWQFVSDVFAAVATVTPGAYLHLGGDEAFGMPIELHAAFVTRAIAEAEKVGKKIIGWQEIARGQVNSNTVVEHWIDPVEVASMMDSEELAAMIPPAMLEPMKAIFAEAVHDVKRAVDQGAWVLLAPTSGLYLDRKYSEASVNSSQAETQARVGLPFYKPKTVRETFEWLPEDVEMHGASDRIAGVEAVIWCETVNDFSDLQFLILPRLPGIAERAWSRNAGTWGEHKDRLAAHSKIWRKANWNYFASELIAWPTADLDITSNND